MSSVDDQLLDMIARELPHRVELLRRARAVLRINDVPRSFYPGMWLRAAEEGKPYTDPTAEVISVGRTRVTIQHAGVENLPETISMADARTTYRKVYEKRPPEGLPGWIKEGAEFTAYNWGFLKIRTIRWSYASVEVPRGVLTFWSLEGIARKGRPRKSAWDILLTDDI